MNTHEQWPRPITTMFSRAGIALEGEIPTIRLSNMDVLVVSLGADVRQVEETISRIVACVNACRGLPTELLESMPDIGERIAHENLDDYTQSQRELKRKYRHQCDELLEALERMCKMHVLMMGKVNHAASFFDADCIREMNEAPIQAAKAIKLARADVV